MHANIVCNVSQFDIYLISKTNTINTKPNQISNILLEEDVDSEKLHWMEIKKIGLI